MTCLRPTLLLLALAGFGLSASCSSNTTKQISAFADKICKCSDAACASAVEAEYLQWWKDNQRARGSEGDRKDIEKAMERYAECHTKLVGPGPERPPVTIPKIDLTRPAPNQELTPPPADQPLPAEGVAPASAPEAPAASEDSTQPSAGAGASTTPAAP